MSNFLWCKQSVPFTYIHLLQIITIIDENLFARALKHTRYLSKLRFNSVKLHYVISKYHGKLCDMLRLTPKSLVQSKSSELAPNISDIFQT